MLVLLSSAKPTAVWFLNFAAVFFWKEKNLDLVLNLDLEGTRALGAKK
jgi:hypothetical protein